MTASLCMEQGEELDTWKSDLEGLSSILLDFNIMIDT